MDKNDTDLWNDIIAGGCAVAMVVIVLSSLYGIGTVLVAIGSLLPWPDMGDVIRLLVGALWGA